MGSYRKNIGRSISRSGKNIMKNVSIIIVSYNTRDILQKCIQSIYDSVISATFEIIVVDNASSDESSEMIKNEFKEVILIENKENIGFAAANNMGIKKSNGNYLLFLNSDTFVFRNSIDSIFTFLNENLRAGAATCRVELPDGNIDDASHRGFPTPWNSLAHFSGLAKVFPKTKLFAGYSLGYLDKSTNHEIDACAGAYMMVRREAGEQVGWWDEDYFFYGEDIDFCYRLRQMNWEIWYVPSVKILHYKGVSGGIKEISKNITTANSETKKRATQARFDAMKIFYQKHYAQKYPKFITWVTLAGINVKKTITKLG